MDFDFDLLLRRTRMAAKLVLDTANHPRAARAHGTGAVSRHLIYELDQLCLDLRLDPVRDSQRVLVGHLTDRLDPLKPMAGVPVLLTSGEEVVAATASDRQGEFQIPFEPRDTLALFLPLGEDRLIEVSVTY